MGLPPEDLPPTWIRDYDTLYDIGGGHHVGDGSGTGVTVDMPAMQDFAAALEKNVDDEYNPHAHVVFDDMTTQVQPADGFVELQWALGQHRDVQVTATDNVANQGNGAKVFAHAASEIAKSYQGADAYAAARLDDVRQYLGTTPTTPATTDPTTSPTNPTGGV